MSLTLNLQTEEVKKLDSSYLAEKKCWEIIAPFWPLKNLIAVNPLKGFESLSFEKALDISQAYFRSDISSLPLQAINRESIKWLQAFFDEGQATIQMPQKNSGFFSSWKQLAIYDKRLHKNNKKLKAWLKTLPDSAEETISLCVSLLCIKEHEKETFFKLLLATLPGWASYIQHLANWSMERDSHFKENIQMEYLAFRLTIAYLLWPEAKLLLKDYEKQQKTDQEESNILRQIEANEQKYRLPLLKKLAKQTTKKQKSSKAQFVFCIDVRSEPFRRALEKTGPYETYGFAGFFGVPVQIQNTMTLKSFASCPVLLSPKHPISETLKGNEKDLRKKRQGFEFLKTLKKIYQSLKYNLATPFALAESLGSLLGIRIIFRTFTPLLSSKIKKIGASFFLQPQDLVPHLETISLPEQCTYAENALRMMGLTENFSPLVIFCGHGGAAQNNAFSAALHCGACAGQNGFSNARVLAGILNQREVRAYLKKQKIFIPQTTIFIGASHNTTTDEVTFCSTIGSNALSQLKKDLEEARQTNCHFRMSTMSAKKSCFSAKKQALKQSLDWSEVRPEWGLAKNASFIVAPRSLTESLNLEGRSFLHSYDYTRDEEGKYLNVILTAPMVVAQWINAQYFFSTFDNVSYGAGSKVTKNITGKIGVMQGNASDLMTGLPLQSVNLSDTQSFHELLRLMTVVYAPLERLNQIIQKETTLQKLFGNGWVQLVCLEPKAHQAYFLQRDFSWKKLNEL